MPSANKPYKVVQIYTPDPEVMNIVMPTVPPGFELVFCDGRDDAAVKQALADADFVIAIKLTADQIAAAPRLKMVQLQGVGFDSVDCAALSARGIPVAATVPGTCNAVAEHVFLLVLALYKRLLEADRSVREGRWLCDTLRTGCYLLQGKTVGIIGLGRIGREVAKRLQGWGVTIVYNDIVDPGPAVEAALDVAPLSRDELLCRADIVTLHVPLTPLTRGFMAAREFGMMKPTAILINTSRGPVLDEHALYHALKEKRILAAALDVYNPEPPRPDNPLFQLSNVLLTPHMSAGTRDSLRIKGEVQFANFQRFLRGEPILDQVTP